MEFQEYLSHCDQNPCLFGNQNGHLVPKGPYWGTPSCTKKGISDELKRKIPLETSEIRSMMKRQSQTPKVVQAESVKDVRIWTPSKMSSNHWTVISFWRIWYASSTASKYPNPSKTMARMAQSLNGAILIGSPIFLTGCKITQRNSAYKLGKHQHIDCWCPDFHETKLIDQGWQSKVV